MHAITLDPQQKIGVTSDTHFGHANIIAYCLRPWLSPQEQVQVMNGNRIPIDTATLKAHDDALIERTNALLAADDILIHCGDIAWGNRLEEYRERLNVKTIYVVAGNHDKEMDLCRVFGSHRVFERAMLKVGSQHAVLDHYPGDSWCESHHGTWLLYGHVHGMATARRERNPAWSLSLDVGVDSHDYRPWLWSELLPHFRDRKPAWQAWRNGLTEKHQGGMAVAQA